MTVRIRIHHDAIPRHLRGSVAGLPGADQLWECAVCGLMFDATMHAGGMDVARGSARRGRYPLCVPLCRAIYDSTAT